MDCSYFNAAVCRSCSLLEQSYESTLAQKQHWLKALFPNVVIEPITPSPVISGSRIRARVAVFGDCAAPHFGFLNEQRQIAAVDQCPLHDPAINRLLTRLPALIAEYRLAPYVMADDTGELKFVVVTWSQTHQQLMLQLVLRSRESVDRIRRLWREHQQTTFCDVAVLSVNLQPVRSSALNGREEIPISDNRRLSLRYGGATIQYGSQSFVQTNYQVAELLYRRSTELLNQHGARRLTDLYCGTGAFSLTAATPETVVYGFDVATDAVACANESALQNGVISATFIAHASGVIGLAVDHPLHITDASDAVICNPPRSGLDEAARQFVARQNPPLVLYSSCNPETLKRDTDLLSSQFRLAALAPFDMFPMTTHLEVLAVLERIGSVSMPAVNSAPTQEHPDGNQDLSV